MFRGEEAHGEAFFEEGVAFVFLVGEDGADCAVIPFLASHWCGYTVCVELGGDLDDGVCGDAIALDASYDTSFVFNDDGLAVFAAFVAEKALEWHIDSRILKTFAVSPCDILADRQ